MADFVEEDDEESVFRGLAELPANPQEMRKSCDRCKLVLSHCKSSGSWQILTLPGSLQYPLLDLVNHQQFCQDSQGSCKDSHQENRLLATVPLLAACLPPEKCQIYKGRRFSKNEFPHLHEMALQPNTLILYPGPSAVDIKTVVVSQHCHLIVPDGTWRQAKDIFRNNPFLHNTARQVLVDHKNVSEYVIRTQPNNRCLSTLEAIAIALSVLEKNAKLHKILTRPLRALCQIQLDHGAVPHISKEERKELEERQSQGTKEDTEKEEENKEASDEEGSLSV